MYNPLVEILASDPIGNSIEQLVCDMELGFDDLMRGVHRLILVALDVIVVRCLVQGMNLAWLAYVVVPESWFSGEIRLTQTEGVWASTHMRIHKTEDPSGYVLGFIPCGQVGKQADLTVTHALAGAEVSRGSSAASDGLFFVVLAENRDDLDLDGGEGLDTAEPLTAVGVGSGV